MNPKKCLVAAFVVVTGVGAVAGCGQDKSQQKATSVAASDSAAGPGSSAGGAPANYDIGKIGAAKSALPQGFQATDIPKATVSQEQLDAPGLGGLTSTARDVVTPAECAVLLKPLGQVGAGAQAQGFIADKGEHMVVVMAAQTDKNAAPSPTGCDHITVNSSGGVSGTVDRIAAPTIDGAATGALKAHATSGGKAMNDTMFTALLGDHTLVVVQGDLAPTTAADLLSKAVAALRG